MKKLKYILLFIIAVSLFNSCESVVQTGDVYDIKDGKNLVMFAKTKIAATQIAESGEYATPVKVKLEGPTTANVSGDLQVTVSVDAAASTAVEGTHYRLDNAAVVLKKSENYIGLVNFTMLTAGIQTPLDESPVLVLNVNAVSGDGKVINSGKPVKVTLNYACPSELQGNYTVVVLRDGGVITPYTNVTITKTGIGIYRTSEVGHWPASSLGYTPGFTFSDVCGVLDVPQQNLVEAYGNQVQSTEPGSVDYDNGVLHIVYSISSSGWSSVYDCTYTPVD